MFICLSCSGIHRNIPQVSKVKSVRLDVWDEAQVEVRAGGGGPGDFGWEAPSPLVLQALAWACGADAAGNTHRL